MKHIMNAYDMVIQPASDRDIDLTLSVLAYKAIQKIEQTMTSMAEAASQNEGSTHKQGYTTQI